MSAKEVPSTLIALRMELAGGGGGMLTAEPNNTPKPVVHGFKTLHASRRPCRRLLQDFTLPLSSMGLAMISLLPRTDFVRRRVLCSSQRQIDLKISLVPMF